MEYCKRRIKSLGETILWTHLSFSETEVEQLECLLKQAQNDEAAQLKIGSILSQIQSNRVAGNGFDYAVGIEVHDTAELSRYRINITSAFRASHLERGGKRHIFELGTLNSSYKYYVRSDQLPPSEKRKFFRKHPSAKQITTAVCTTLLPLMDDEDYRVLSTYEELEGKTDKAWSISAFLRMCSLYTSGYKANLLDNVHQKITAIILTKLSRAYAETHLIERLDNLFMGKRLTETDRVKATMVMDENQMEKEKKSFTRVTDQDNSMQKEVIRLLGKVEDLEDLNFHQLGHQWHTGYFIAGLLPPELQSYLTKKKKQLGIHSSRMTLLTPHGTEFRDDFLVNLVDAMKSFPFGAMDEFRRYYDQHLTNWSNLLYKRTGNEETDDYIDNLILSGDSEAAFVSCYSAMVMRKAASSLVVNANNEFLLTN